jgi:hypothetical protein
MSKWNRKFWRFGLWVWVVFGVLNQLLEFSGKQPQPANLIHVGIMSLSILILTEREAR